MIQEPAIERALGATEEMYWRFDAISPINFGAVSRLRGTLDYDQLRRGLLALQYRHPLLRVHIAPDGRGRPWYRSGVGQIPLDIEDATPADVWPRLERELVTVMPAEGPLMRVIVLRHGGDELSLMMVFHHAISDGRSSVFLLRDLLTSLAQMQRGESPDLEPLEPLEYYGERIPPLDNYDAKTALQTLKASAKFMEDVGLPTGMFTPRDQRLPFHQQTIMIEPRVIDAALMARIAQKAKAERTTLQCVLNAALSLAVAQDTPTRAIQRTGCTQVLDIRSRLVPPVGEDVGCFASGATSLHRLDEATEFWPLARKVHEHLQHAIVTPLPFFFPAMHRILMRISRRGLLAHPERFGKFISRLHPEGLAVSNLGRVAIEVEGSPLTVESYGFATNTMVLNYLNTSAATLGGRMIWTFNGSSQLTRERLVRLADDAVARIVQALDD